MPYELKVKHVMKRNVITLTELDTAQNAAQEIVSNRIGCVVVQDHQNFPLGIVTERDIVSKVVAETESKNIPLAEIMSSPILTVSPSSTLADAARKMSQNDVNYLNPIHNK